MTDDDLLAWVDARLAELSLERTGPADVVAAQPWGRVLRVPTAGDPVWCKVPAPAMRFEIALLDRLGGLPPAITPRVLAADATAGVMLLADAGISYSDAYDEDELPGRFAAALARVGHLQRSSVPLVPDLLAAGVPDLRPGRTLERFDELVRDVARVPATVAAGRPLLAAAVARLCRSAVPAAIDHNDLHDGNLLVDRAGVTTVIDWGDAVVTHPFAVLLVAQRVLSSLLGDVGWDHPTIVAARRGYLAGFADLAPGEDLERTARLAVLVAHLGRAWAWHRALLAFAATGQDAGRFADAPREWLGRTAAALRDAVTP